MNALPSEWLELALAPRSAMGLLVRITLSLALAWLIHGALARANPRWRVLTWRLAAATAILLPLATWLLPVVSLRWLPAKSPAATASVEAPSVDVKEAAVADKTVATAMTLPASTSLESVEDSAHDVRQSSKPHTTPISEVARTPVAAGASFSWLWMLLGTWLSGVLIGLLAEMAAWWQLSRVLHRAELAPKGVREIGDQVAVRLRCRQQFEICQSRDVTSPCVVGLLKPVILLPVVDCDVQQRVALAGILAHEIAHITNLDLAWDAMLRWFSRVLWFHPLAWKMRSAHLSACDAVCDATAADHLGDVDSYSSLLAQMALRVAANAPRPALPMARPSSVRLRITALQRHVYASPLSRRVVWLSAAICGLGLLLGGALSLARTQSKERVDQQGDPLPEGAIARLGTTRYRYGGHEVIILPDGVTCLSRYMSGPIRVWNARNGKLIRDMSFADFGFEHMHVSPDGTLLGLFGYTRSPDHKSHVEVRVVRTDTGELVRSFPRETQAGNSLAFTGDNKRVISMGADAIARVEDLTTGKEIAQRKFTVGGYGRVSVSPDGQWIGIVTGRGQCFTWDGKADSAPREHKLPGSMFDAEDETKLEFSPDSRSMVICDLHHNLLVLETSSGKLLQRLASAGELFNEPLDFSPDGSRLYTGCYSRARKFTTRVWDTKTWREVENIDFHGKLSPDGKLLVNRNRVFDLQQRKELNVDAGHDDTVWSLWPLSKERVLTGGDDGSIRAWNAATGEQVQRWDHEKTGWGPDISAIAVSPDDKYLLSAANDNTVRLWNLAEPKEVFRLPGHGTLGANFRALGFTAQGREFCSFGPDYRLRIYDTRRGKALHEFLLKPKEVAFPAEDTPAAAMVVTNAPALSADAKLLAVDYFDKIYVFDTFSGKVLQILEPKGGMILSMRFSPDNTRLLASPWEGEGRGAQLWDVKTGKLLQSIPTPKLPRACFSPDGTQITVAVLDANGKASTLQIYTLNGTLTGTLAVPQQVSKLVFTTDGKAIVTAHHDGNALVWNVDAFVKPTARQPKP